jgi:aspartate 1-decarboxylase
MRWQLRSKIHKATVTQANLTYVGSITIDSALLEKTGLREWEKVLVASFNSGERLETYIIKGKKNSGIIAMNGPAALKIKKGERVVVMGFELTNKMIKPKMIVVDGKNKFLRYLKNEISS